MAALKAGAGRVQALRYNCHVQSLVRTAPHHSYKDLVQRAKPLQSVLGWRHLPWEAVLAIHLHASSSADSICAQ